MKKLPSISFCCFFIGFVLLLLQFSKPIYAQILQNENQCILSGTNCTSAPSGIGFDDKAFNLNQLGGTIDNLNYFLSGKSESHPEIFIAHNGGALANISGLIGKLYTPPASSIQYLAYLRQNLGLAAPVYAQAGGGFTGLQYILPLWRVFRDTAYAIYILLFVVTGLLIMFRVKISPQTVISIQNSLPRLLYTLLLITLSYAIAGLLIDLTYVIIGLLINIFSQVGGVNLGKLATGYQSLNVFKYWSEGNSLGFKQINQAAEAIATMVGDITGNTFLLSGILSAPSRGIIFLIFSIAILVALFRLFFILLRSYVWVLVLVIFAPFQLLMSSLPGGNGFSGWIRGVAANLAVFPTTIAMFLLSSTLIQRALAVGGGSTNPFNNWTAPLIGANDVRAVQYLVSLGILLITPTVAQMMNDALKPPPFPYGAAMGQALGAGPAVTGGVARRGAAALGYEQYDAGGGRIALRRRSWRALF